MNLISVTLLHREITIRIHLNIFFNSDHLEIKLRLLLPFCPLYFFHLEVVVNADLKNKKPDNFAKLLEHCFGGETF